MTFNQPVTWVDRIEAEAELAKSHYQYNRKIGEAGYVSVYFDDNPAVADRIGSVIHSQIVCPGNNGSSTLRRVPTFYEEDGTRKAVWQGHESEVRACRTCVTQPSLTEPWRKEARCRDSGGDLVPWGDDYPIFMEVYCEECPVVGECLEFGISEGGRGTVYGGIYFSQDKKQRELAIELRRRELETQPTGAGNEVG